MDMSHARTTPAPMAAHGRGGALARTLLVGLIAFLTVIDLFGTQAILPALTRAYGVTPAAMGLAVNASTFGMAVAGLAVAYFSRRIDRRRGILASLALLAVPTALLASAPDLATFALLRVAQGLCMASAFTLTLAYLGEHCDATTRPAPSRPISPATSRAISSAGSSPPRLADHLGLGPTFYGLAVLNLAGVVLVHLGLTHATALPRRGRSFPVAVRDLDAEHLATRVCGRALRSASASSSPSSAPSPTSISSSCARRSASSRWRSASSISSSCRRSRRRSGRPRGGALGTRPALWGGLGIAAAGLPLLVLPSLPAVLAGLALVGIGTFFAQATATGFVSRTAAADRASASGLYLASYFLGGLVGSAVLGQIFDRFGWGGLRRRHRRGARARGAPRTGASIAPPLSTRQRAGISPRFPASA